MRKIEDRQHVLAHVGAGCLVVIQSILQLLGFDLHLRGFGREGSLLDHASQIALEQPLLHLLDFREPFARHPVLLFTHARLVVTGHGQVPPEPVPPLVVRDVERCEVVFHRLLELVLPPANHRVLGVRFEVAASIVYVLMDAATLHPPHDPFAGDPKTAVGADEHAAG